MSAGNPDDFERMLDQHPELGVRDKDQEPATTASKQALYDLIQTKVGPCASPAFMRSRTFTTPDKAVTISATTLRPGVKRNGDRIATVTSTTAQHEKTKITVTDSPDGLQLSKKITTQETTPRIVGGLAWGQTASLFGEGYFDPTTRQARAEADAFENELGLHFVSEAETRGWITLLGSAQPQPG